MANKIGYFESSAASQLRQDYLSKQRVAEETQNAYRKAAGVVRAWEVDNNVELTQEGREMMIADFLKSGSIRSVIDPNDSNEEEPSPVLPVAATPAAPTKNSPAPTASLIDRITSGISNTVSALGAKMSEGWHADDAGEIGLKAYALGNLASTKEEAAAESPLAATMGLIQKYSPLVAGSTVIKSMLPEAVRDTVAQKERDSVTADIGTALEEQAARGRRAAAASDALGKGSFLDEATSVVAGVLSRPEQSLSALGGGASKLLAATGVGASAAPFVYGALASPAAVTVAQESYGQAIAPATAGGLGMTPNEAAAYSVLRSAVEMGMEAVGGEAVDKALGVFGKKVGKEGLQHVLEEVVASRKKRIASAAGVGAAEEALTNVANVGADVLFAGSDFASKQDSRDALVGQADTNIADVGANTVRSAVAGGLQSGVMASPHALYDYSRARKDVQDYRASSIAENEQSAILQARAEAEARAQKIKAAAEAEANRGKQGNLFATDDGTNGTYEEQAAARQKQQEEDAAWGIRNKQATKEARVDELRQSVVNRVDTARNEVEHIQGLIEGGATDSATLNEAAAANKRLKEAEDALTSFDKSFTTPPTTKQESPTQQELPVQGELPLPESPDVLQAKDNLMSARERLLKEANKKAANEQKAEAARRKNLAIQVVREHGDKTPEEQVDIYNKLVAEYSASPAPVPAASKVTPTLTDKVQSVINQVEGLRKRTNTARVNNKIRSLYKQDPTRTAQDIANILNEQEGAPQTIADGEIPTEEELRAKVAELNKKNPSLSMSAPVETAEVREQEAASDNKAGPVVPRTKEKQKQHEANVKALLQSMGNTQENVDIFNLVHQGKLILTDRPETVGREAKAAPAEFDTGSGKMYVYLDNFDPSKGKEVMLQAAAQHEAGHAGQHYQRDGRNNLFRNLLGDKGNAAANKTIRDAAKSGNKLAQAAVDKATEAAKANNSFTNVEDLELVPHLFSEAKIGNHAPGTVGKVIRDVKNAARAVTRKTLNKELDYSVDELAAAGSGVAGEIVKTDVQPADGNNGDLNMIYPVGTRAGDKEANLSRLYKSVDGREKYVLTDEGAKLKAGSVFRLLDSPNSGEQLKVDDLLAHDTLYDIMPEARNIPVVLDSSIKGFAAYDPNPDAKYISVHPDLLQGRTRTQVKEALLHEIQHYVQDHTGGEGQFFDERNIPGIKEHDKELAAATKVRTVASNAVLGNVAALTKNAPMSVKQRIPGIVTNHRIKDDAVKVVQLRQLLQMNGIYQEGEGAKLLARWEAANREYHEIEAERRGVVNEHYMTNINEREAFRTQLDSNKSQAELDARGNPERAMRTQGKELDFGQRGDGRIDVPEGNGRIVARGDDLASMSDEKPVTAEMNRRHTQGSLAMSAPKKKDKAANPKFSAKERITRIVSHGRQDRLDLSKTAEDLHSSFVDAIRKDTGKPELTAEMDNAFKEFLSSPEHATVEGREKIISDLAAKYPETTEVLTEIRDLISDLTVDTIQEMVASGRPLSIEQRKNIETMLANKDTYMSRAYAAFQGEKGRKWAETRWTNFYRNLNRDLSVIKNDKVRADVEEVRNGIKTIVDGLRIPDESALQDLPMDRLVSLAAKHNIKEDMLQFDRNDPDATWLKRDELISDLLKVKSIYPEGRLEDMAMETAKDLLGLGDRDNAYAKQMSDLTKNPGTLNKREHVPLEIRRMLGEIDLAPGAFLATLSNQAALRARAKVISELVNEPNSDIVITQDDYYNLPKDDSANKTLLERAATAANPMAGITQADFRRVEGEQWGVMSGMYLRKEAYARLNETVEAFETMQEALKHGVFSTQVGKKVAGGILKATGAVNRWTKLPTVVGNPVNYLAQWLGSHLNMLGAGNFSGSAWLGGKKAAWDYMGGTWSTTTTPRLSEVMRHMNLESADIAEIQRILGTKIEDYFDGTKSLDDAAITLQKHARGLAGRAGKTALAFYAIADNWSKIANFYHRAKILDAVNEASGKPKTREQILQEAGDDTSYTNISPERVADLIRKGESAGFTQFAPYFAEVFRTRYTGYALAVKDLAHSNQLRAEGHTKAANIMARAAASRMLGHTVSTLGMPMVGSIKVASRLAAMGVPVAIAQSLAQAVGALGADDDDNKLKRRLLPEHLKFQDITQIGVNSKNYPMFWGWSQKVDPSGPMTDILRIMTYADDDVTAANNLNKYLYDNLFIVPQVWKDLAKAIQGESTAPSDIGRALDVIELKSDFVKASGAKPETVDRYLNVLDNFIPGGMRAWKDQYRPDDLQADESTKARAKALNAVGFRFDTFNPRVALQSYSRVSNQDKKDNARSVHDNLLNIKGVDESTIMAATQDYFKREMSRQIEDYQNVRSLRQGWGFDDAQTKALLIEGGYGKEYVKTLAEGAAHVELSVPDLEKYADSSSRYLSDNARQERIEHAEKVAKMLLEMKDKLAELGIEVTTKGS